MKINLPWLMQINLLAQRIGRLRVDAGIANQGISPRHQSRMRHHEKMQYTDKKDFPDPPTWEALGGMT